MSSSTRALSAVALTAALAVGATYVARARQRQLAEVTGTKWSPQMRLVRGAVGGALVAWGSRHRGAVGAVADLAGSALLLRSTTNRSLLYLARKLRQRSHEVRTAVEKGIADS